MSLEALTSKYIGYAEEVFKKLEKTLPIDLNEAKLAEVLCYAKDYLNDAKYYKNKGNLETSLSSIAYCEGILDALRLLGAVKFEWPIKQEKQES
jgi:hypothetical protein